VSNGELPKQPQTKLHLAGLLLIFLGALFPTPSVYSGTRHRSSDRPLLAAVAHHLGHCEASLTTFPRTHGTWPGLRCCLGLVEAILLVLLVVVLGWIWWWTTFI